VRRCDLAGGRDAESREEDGDEDAEELHVDEESLCVVTALHLVEVAEVLELLKGHGTCGGDKTTGEDDTDSNSDDAVDLGDLVSVVAGLDKGRDEGKDGEGKEHDRGIDKGIGLDVPAVGDQEDRNSPKQEELKGRPHNSTEADKGADTAALLPALDLVGFVDTALNERCGF